MQQYLKTLDYYNDISFNSFLFPNVKDTRKILSFLFEIMFKDEEDPDKNQPTNTFEVLLKRRLHKFHNKPWVIPEFLKIHRPLFLGAGDQILVQSDIDAERIANCKSKKAKGVYEMMKALTAAGAQSHAAAY
mmetsp:Transcript_14564/g.22612  ORF Transcript_14564/g.22612 Transcript_14564/m.22612 type:complete len:132 (+) Transcript_14564:232-627(+)